MKLVRLFGLLGLLVFVSPVTAQEAPQRVVSMNLCTDQLAIQIAAPGQLVSVSYLSTDPSSSLISENLQDLYINHGLAEEILRLNPDLIIAGQYTTRTTVHLLRRLGLRVEEFPPSQSFEDIRNNIRKMGKLLHRSAEAEKQIQAFDKKLAWLMRTNLPVEKQPVLGIYSLNSYVSGKGSLESEMTQAAGLRHMGSELGFVGAGRLSLESLIVTNPDQLMTWKRWSRFPTRASEVQYHPALLKWFGRDRRISLDQRHWICGTPAVLDGVEALKTRYDGSAHD